MIETFEQFLKAHGRPPHEYPIYRLDPDTDDLASIIVEYGDKTALLTMYGLGSGDQAHLTIDVHAFVQDLVARTGVFGLENGRRYEAFADGAPGTSHGWPAVRGVSVLIGRQQNTPPPQTGQAPPAAPGQDPLYVWALSPAQRDLVLAALAKPSRSRHHRDLGTHLAAIAPLPPTSVTFDYQAARDWLTANADDLGIDAHTRNTHEDDEFVAALDQVLARLRQGLAPQVWHTDGMLDDVCVWRTADSDGPDGGAVISVDLRTGSHTTRLASNHQAHGDLTEDSELTGVDAVVQALGRTAHLINTRLAAAQRFIAALGGADTGR
ncbi:hypothetical protein AB0B66_10565 [Catellatospora sp. NPDC049111]|uniref:hypothetical protein n=1 Tax=Catellatospora sp. NPDC049111 TaxID=3155271 RepID=UPI0033E43EDA